MPLHFPDQFFPCRTHVPLDFPSQIVKPPQVLSHLLLVIAIFPLPHPCAMRFPSSKRQIPTSPISSAFCGRYFPLPRPSAIRFPRSNRQMSTSPISSAFCGRYFFPCRAHVPLDFPGQIVKSPQVLSHLLFVVAIFPLPRPSAIRFPRSNRQIPTSPISSVFTRGRASWLPLPILIFNGKLPEAMWETPEVHSETGYRQQQGDTWPSVLREPCRCPLQATTGRHVAVRSPRAVSLPVIKTNMQQ